MSKTSKNQVRPNPTSPQDASRVQGAVARKTGGIVPTGSYVGRLQRAAGKNQVKTNKR